MSVPQFTPGPWLITDDGNMVYALHSVPDRHGVPFDANRFSASVQGYRNGAQKEEIAATAHLIAAAPDMYAALEGMERLFAINGEGLMRGKVANEIRAALAKARGEI